MALKIIQICDGCGKTRGIRNVKDSETHQWIEFYDNRNHLCPKCVKEAILERERDIHGTQAP